MAYEITSESYGRRLPKITATADSTDDLATLGTDWAEGSTCTISDTTYKLDKVAGWVDPSSGGGGGGATVVELTRESDSDVITANVKAGALWEAAATGLVIFVEKTEGAINGIYTLVAAVKSDAYIFEVTVGSVAGPTSVLIANTADDYPASTSDD